MTFKSTDWEFSNMPSEAAGPMVGEHYLVIEHAEYDGFGHMDISFKSITDESSFRIRYFMFTKAGEPNTYTGRVLKSLGRAVNNEDKPLAPVDLEGAIVCGDVTYTVPKKDGDKAYPKIEEFRPVSKEFAEYSAKPDQYFYDEEE